MAKARVMSATQKRNLREARYKKLYGENWQEVLKIKHGDGWEAFLNQDRSENVDLLGKTEYLSLIAIRVRNPDTNQSVVADLLRLYAEVKHWIGIRPRPGKVGRHLLRTPDPKEEENINTLVQRIEENKRRKA